MPFQSITRKHFHKSAESLVRYSVNVSSTLLFVVVIVVVVVAVVVGLSHELMASIQAVYTSGKIQQANNIEHDN